MLLYSFKNILESLSLQCCSLAWELGKMGKGMGGSWMTNRREAWRWCKRRERVRREAGAGADNNWEGYRLGLSWAKRRTGNHGDVEGHSHVKAKDGDCLGETLKERQVGQGHWRQGRKEGTGTHLSKKLGGYVNLGAAGRLIFKPWLWRERQRERADTGLARTAGLI